MRGKNGYLDKIIMLKFYKIMFFVSMGLTLAAVIVALIFGLNLGIDFKGGSIMELEFTQERPSVPDIQQALSDNFPVKDISLSPSGERGLIIRTGEISEEHHQAIIRRIKSNFSNEFQEKKFDSVGPLIGQELKGKSITAMIIVLLVIVIYIALVFRKLSVILSPWVMGGAAIVALLHDVLIPVGVFSLLGHFNDVEISAVFVAAALTILGYSVSDTVVIFDRVRENVIRNKAREEFGKLVHKSIMQTLTRSLNTTFTTLLSLVAIYIFGGESVRYFSLALIIGIFLGAYSSIFVASPLLIWWSQKRG